MMERVQGVQIAAVVGALAVLLWSIPGLVINPDFATGTNATSKVVLGVDMNGWHAVSGFLIALPALWFPRNARHAALFVPFAAGSLIATAVWALIDERPAAGLFYFPHFHTDAWLHFGVSAIFLAGFAHFALRSRRGAYEVGAR